MGDIELGAKYRFVQETNGFRKRGFSRCWRYLRQREGQFGQRPFPGISAVVGAKKLGGLDAYGGAGYGINDFSQSQNWEFGGGVLQKQVLTNVLIGVEVYHQTQLEQDFPNTGTAFNVGTVIDFNDHEHLLFSAPVVGRAGQVSMLHRLAIYI